MARKNQAFGWWPLKASSSLKVALVGISLSQTLINFYGQTAQQQIGDPSPLYAL
jgi:hypothetical protein